MVADGFNRPHTILDSGTTFTYVPDSEWLLISLCLMGIMRMCCTYGVTGRIVTIFDVTVQSPSPLIDVIIRVRSRLSTAFLFLICRHIFCGPPPDRLVLLSRPNHTMQGRRRAGRSRQPVLHHPQPCGYLNVSECHLHHGRVQRPGVWICNQCVRVLHHFIFSSAGAIWIARSWHRRRAALLV